MSEPYVHLSEGEGNEKNRTEATSIEMGVLEEHGLEQGTPQQTPPDESKAEHGSRDGVSSRVGESRQTPAPRGRHHEHDRRSVMQQFALGIEIQASSFVYLCFDSTSVT